MKASHAWLCELAGLEASPDEIAERLTRAGIEVEGIQPVGHQLDRVVIAEVRGKRPHPSRDKLTLVSVFDGRDEAEIVCGASNVPEAGGRVLLAQVGASLPGGLTIAPREVGGVTSHGMLCSEVELGIGMDADGIVVLDRSVGARTGARIADALSLRDHVFEISLTPNRPDCLGHVGLARELALLFDRPFARRVRGAPARVLAREVGSHLPSFEIIDSSQSYPGETLNLVEPMAGLPLAVPIEIRDASRCSRYLGLVMHHVKVRSAPLWMRYRLHILGQRAIDSVVDATNYVLLETGHPIHAFDLGALGKGDPLRAEVVVRLAHEGERMVTLDGIERSLSADDLVIADAASPVALAGVMGGKESGVRAGTRSILLEVAYFEPRSIRRTSRRHGLHTEASHRFERGCDPLGLEVVMRRAAMLLSTVADAAAAPAATDAHARRITPVAIPLREGAVAKLLGLEVPAAVSRRILEGVGCTIAPAEIAPAEIAPAEIAPAQIAPGQIASRMAPAEIAPAQTRLASGGAAGRAAGEKGGWRVTAPTFRPDLTRPEDLIEEIARVHGYDHIPSELAASRPRAEPPDPRHSLLRALREAAVGAGLHEAVNFAFVSPRELELARAPLDALPLANPLSEERSVMRTSLLPGLLSDVARAQRHQAARAALFEVGKTYHPAIEGRRPIERTTMAIVLSGPRESWLGDRAPFDVYDGKGALEAVLGAVGLSPQAQRASVSPGAPPSDAVDLASALPHLHPARCARIEVGGQVVGELGEVHPDVVEALGVSGRPVFAALDLDRVVELAVRAGLPQARPLPRFPAITRDLALVLDEAATAAEVERIAREAAPLAERVELFDVYRGKPVPEGKKSLALRIWYRDAEGTLTDARAEEAHAAVIAQLGARLGAALRG